MTDTKQISDENDGWMSMDSAPIDGTPFQAQLSNNWIVTMRGDFLSVERKCRSWTVTGGFVSVPYEPSFPEGKVPREVRAVCWRHLPEPTIRFEGSLAQRHAAETALEIAGTPLPFEWNSDAYHDAIRELGRSLYELDADLVKLLDGLYKKRPADLQAAVDEKLRVRISNVLHSIEHAESHYAAEAAQNKGMRP